jgi:hypothetical protein
VPLQRFPSLQPVPFVTGVFSQPVAGLQLSAVQTLLSSQFRAVPAVHVPPWQVSAPLQRFPSLQAVPFVTGVFAQPVAGLQLSVVQAFSSSQVRAAPAVHIPP